MGKQIKRVLSMIMALAMVFSLLPMGVLADEAISPPAGFGGGFEEPGSKSGGGGSFTISVGETIIITSPISRQDLCSWSGSGSAITVTDTWENGKKVAKVTGVQEGSATVTNTYGSYWENNAQVPAGSETYSITVNPKEGGDDVFPVIGAITVGVNKSTTVEFYSSQTYTADSFKFWGNGGQLTSASVSAEDTDKKDNGQTVKHYTVTVNGLAVGSSSIYLAQYDGSNTVGGTIPVTVSEGGDGKPSGKVYNGGSITIKVGDSTTLSDGKTSVCGYCAWSSSDSTLVSVDGSGNILGMSPSPTYWEAHPAQVIHSFCELTAEEHEKYGGHVISQTVYNVTVQNDIPSDAGMTYTITATLHGETEHGHLLRDIASGSITVPAGHNLVAAQWSADTGEGYNVVDVKIDGISLYKVAQGGNTYEFTNVHANHTVDITIAKDKGSLTVYHRIQGTNQLMAITNVIVEDGKTYCATELGLAVAPEDIYNGTATITIGDGTHSFEVLYVPQNIGYIVHYYLKDTTTKLAGDKVVGNAVYHGNYTENAIDIPGYKALEPTTQNIVADFGFNELIFYYEPTDPEPTDEKHTVSYTVEYYKDGVKTDETAPVSVEKPLEEAAEVAVSGVNTTDYYGTGYKFKSTNPSPVPGKFAIDAGADSETHVIKVYYEKDESAKHAVSYTVEYYRDGEKKFITEAVTDEAWINEDVAVEVSGVNTTDFFGAGYKFKNTDPETVPAGYTVAAGAESESHVIKVYYVKDESVKHAVSYTVEYYKDGVKEHTTEAVTDEAWIDEAVAVEVKGVNTTDFFGTGYKFKSTDPETVPTGYTVAAGADSESHVIKVYYEKDESAKHAVSYTVEYYRDGEKKFITDAVTDEAWINEAAKVEVSGVNTTDFFGTGYKFKNTDPAEVPADYTVAAGADSESHVIKVYYEKDESIKHAVSYTVEYYKDGVKEHTTDAVTDEAWINEAVKVEVSGVNTTDFFGTGYKFESTDPEEIPGGYTLAAGAESEAHVIKVYYEKDESVKHKVSYTVEYYKDGVKEHTTDAVTDEAWINEAVKVEVSDVNTTDFFGTGYKFKNTDPATVPADYTVAAGAESEAHVIKVYYEKDESVKHKVSYTVEYYKDDELIDTTAAVEDEKWINEAAEVAVTGVNTTDYFGIGYKFKNTNPATVPTGYTVAAGADSEAHVIKVYYEKDAGAKHKVSYTVEYYKDDELIDTTAAVEDEKWINEAVKVEVGGVNTTDYFGTGYKFKNTDPATVPADYTVAAGADSEAHVIKVYYEKDEGAKHVVSVKVIYCIPAEDVSEEGPAVTLEGWINETVTVDTPEINKNHFGAGYDFVDTNPTSVKPAYSVKPGEEKNEVVIHVNFAKNAKKHTLNYIVRYYQEDDDGQDVLMDTVTLSTAQSAWIGDSISLDVPLNLTDKFGAEYSVKRTDPAGLSGDIPLTLAANEASKCPEYAVYYAKKQVPYTVNYLLKGTTEALTDPVTGTGKSGEEVTGYLKQIENCTPVDPDTTAQTITLSAAADNVINFYYQLNLTVTAKNDTKRYGTKDPAAFTAEVDGLREADEAAFAYTVSRRAGEDVKADGYAITPTVTAVPDYYKVTVIPATFTITPRPVVVEAKDMSWPYDGMPHSYEVTAEDPGFTVLAVDGDTDSGLVGSDSIASATLSGSVKAPGSKANNEVSNAVFGTGTKAENYEVIYRPGELAITGAGVQYSLRAVPGSGTFEYDGTEHKVEGFVLEPVTRAGIAVDGNTITVGSDVYTVTGITSVKTMTHVGKAETVISGSAVILDSTGAAAPDGMFALDTTAKGSIEVTKRKVTLQSASAAKQYDGTPLRSTVVTVGGRGFVTGEGAAYRVTGSQTQVGSSTNWFTYTLNNNTRASDYEITTVYGTLTVTPVPVYTLIIHYVDEGNHTLAPDFVGQFAAGDPYYAVSPAVAGYTPDYAFIQSGPNGMPANDVEIFVVYRKEPDEPDDPDEPGGEIVPGDDGYELIPIVEEEVPLAGGEHVDDILHFLLMAAALIVQIIYTDKRKKHQQKIFELKKALGDTSMDDDEE